MKKKLTLDVSTLRVQAFVSGGARNAPGTVYAHNDSGSCTVFANLCYPDSNIMDCWYEEGETKRGCVITP
jgi:hypothetical protein